MKSGFLPRLDAALEASRAALLRERTVSGPWEGELSTSALSTATATVALAQVDPETHRGTIRGGMKWLLDHQNEDGGWGDTVLSFSNISTTLLCWATLHLSHRHEGLAMETNDAERRAGEWIAAHAGSTDPVDIQRAVVARYGRDRTFSVPILMLCAICGRLGEGRDGWRRVLPLPFELAAFPRRWFAALQLPVVSYALPALIAIGYARSRHAPPPLPWRWIRKLAWPRVSRILREIQPASGGFLEAAPLTSFVTMALASCGERDHPVVGAAVEFLLASIRADGSWPIDTNLATWGTTLVVKALHSGPGEPLPEADRTGLLAWLLGQQYRTVHPYTISPPGGWAWTDLSGGVPDADDTPGALLALRHLLPSGKLDDDSRSAVESALAWLAGLQNRDGGIPTFCRGWGALPFDRSSSDLTAHTLAAWHAWRGHANPKLAARLERHQREAFQFLDHQQQSDGSWLPLWFGNQHRGDETNPTYGTAMVMLSLCRLGDHDVISPSRLREMRTRGLAWLLAARNADGGWGGGAATPSSVEETGLAVDALAAARLAGVPLPTAAEEFDAVLQKGADWLIKATSGGREFPVSPIGFYFAKLWYFEKLYPLVWTTSALGRVRAVLSC